MNDWACCKPEPASNFSSIAIFILTYATSKLFFPCLFAIFAGFYIKFVAFPQGHALGGRLSYHVYQFYVFEHAHLSRVPMLCCRAPPGHFELSGTHGGRFRYLFTKIVTTENLVRNMSVNATQTTGNCWNMETSPQTLTYTRIFAWCRRLVSVSLRCSDEGASSLV